MNDLKRTLAPVSERGWKEIEEEARDVLKTRLAGRRVVDFSGPHGWAASAVPLGRVEALGKVPGDGVEASLRKVQPLVELRVDFSLKRGELDDVDRGAADPDLAPVVDAAERLAKAEDQLIFNGYEDGHIRGLCTDDEHAPLTIPESYEDFPNALVEGLAALQDAGVGGGFALVLGTRLWQGLMAAMDPTGYPVIKRVKQILDGPIVRAPAVDGAVLASLRGGDFELYVGRDASIGYAGHTADEVQLYLVESLTFRNLAPEAAIHMVFPEAA